MPDFASPGARLLKLADTEWVTLARELARARQGKDAGVHKARKAMQRLRSLLRLARKAAPEWHARVDGQLRLLRRRLGGLRDAAVRLERVKAMADESLPPAQRMAIAGAVGALQAAHDAAWAAVEPAFWDRMERAVNRLRQGTDQWPLATVGVEVLHTALEQERRRVRKASAAALGHVQRNQRHDLRRRLRRYAAMRKAAAYALRLRDPAAAQLVEVARELGVEGDLWLTSAALRQSASKEATQALRRALEKERRALCKRHDGELASLRRGLLTRDQAGHAARAKAARDRAREIRKSGDVPAK